MKSESENAPDHPDHDHAACITDALADAERFCRQRGLRLTPTRRRVLEIVWRGHEPVKAYDILDALNRAGRRTAPPTVYRALDFLLEASLAHRIDSLNAFVGCPLASGEHTAQLLVCSRCETVRSTIPPFEASWIAGRPAMGSLLNRRRWRSAVSARDAAVYPPESRPARPLTGML